MPKPTILELRQLPISPEQRDEIRTIKANITQGILGGRVYANEGGHVSTRLPSLSRNQQYREYQLGGGNDGTAGKHRLIVLIGSDGKSVEKMYFTANHYETFVEVM